MTVKDPMNHRSGPHGLGGLLWLFALPLLLLPLPATTVSLSLLWLLPSTGWLPDVPSPVLLAVFEIGMLFLLLSISIAAEAFFRRSRHFPALASALLLTWCLLSPLDDLAVREGAIDLQTLLHDLLQDDAQWFVALIALAYLRFSRRVHDTFVVPSRPTAHRDPACWLQEGPQDWSGGVWLIVGALVLMLLYHMISIPEFVDASMLTQTVSGRPSPSSTTPPGTAAALLAGLADGDLAYARFARALLLQHTAGAALALWAARLFVRRSRSMGWAFAASTMLIVTSGLTAAEADNIGLYSGLCLDCDPAENTFPLKLLFATLAIGALALPAVRRRARPMPIGTASST